MDKFEKELQKETNLWIKRIGNYLLSRDDLKENLKKENKSLRECFDYVLIELSKKSQKENGVGYLAGDDEEIYALAVHYYDEDDIKVGKKNFKTNADGTANLKNTLKSAQTSQKKEPSQVDIDKAVEKALEKYKKEEKEKEEQRKAEIKKRKEEAKAKKEAEKKNDNQLRLFDM